jgi:hypothetical protein
MQTNLTLAAVYNRFGWKFQTQDRLIGAVQRACERLMGSNLWEGTAETVDFGVTSDTRIVLPRYFISVLGYSRAKVPRPVFGQFHEYQEQGIGFIDSATTLMAQAIDDGRTCTQKQISGTCILRVKLTNASDGGKIVRFYGKDQDGNRIMTNGEDGIPFTMGYTSADTSQQFSELAAISVQTSTVGRWTLWQVIDGVETQIGAYEPGEDVPNYRAYKVGIRDTSNDEFDTIRFYCRRGYVEPRVLTDLVYPGNMNAIMYGIDATKYEDSGKNDLADRQWARAEKELSDELAAMRGSEIPTLRLEGMALPRIQEIVN